jgi:hypothetical protein
MNFISNLIILNVNKTCIKCTYVFYDRVIEYLQKVEFSTLKDLNLGRAVEKF